MEICRFSRQPKADEFMDFVWDVMETLFRGEAVLTPTTSQLTQNYPHLDQSVYHLQQSIQNTIDCAYKQGIQIGEHEDRLESLESRPVVDAELIDQVQLITSNYMYHPIYQRMFHEIVKMEGRYHQLNQQLKAIRTDINLHHKEHNPEAYTKPIKPKFLKPKPTYFNNVETLFNDMKDQYQSFTTPESAIYRIVEINDGGLHFQVNRYNKASMDIDSVIKAEKRILDSHGLAEYKVYYDGGVEPIVFQAVPKRLMG